MLRLLSNFYRTTVNKKPNFLNQNKILYGFEVVNGYRFNSLLYTGVGVGIILNTEYDKLKTIPIFVELGLNLLRTKLSPFLSARIGYSFAYTYNRDPTWPTGFSSNSGGLLINPSIGLKCQVSKKSAVSLSVGYRLQYYKYNHCCPVKV